MRNDLLLATLLLTSQVHADNISNPQCVSTLSVEARKIYDAVRAAGPSQTDIKSMLRKQTVLLVKKGAVAYASAPESALAAGACLMGVK
jgi:hypothetical protein